MADAMEPSRQHGMLLPADTTDSVIFLQWHAFDATRGQWTSLRTEFLERDAPKAPSHTEPTAETEAQGTLRLLTWNVDGLSAAPAPRISVIMSHILNRLPAVNVIFLQEVTRAALACITADSRIRDRWFLSHVTADGWGGHQYKSLTLMSRATFGREHELPTKTALGIVYRVKYPSLFGRDGLCCDVVVPGCPPTPSAEDPSRFRQVAIVASLLRKVGRGVVAGDFNAVQAEDETLIEACGLVDAWTEVHGQEPGYTWGLDGEQRYPPTRLDRVATLGLRVKDIQVVDPGSVSVPATAGGEPQMLRWSDHSGVMCVIENTL